MQRHSLVMFFCLMIVSFVFPNPAFGATKSLDEEELKARFKAKVATIAVPFIENKGQVDDRVAYYARTFGGTVFVTRSGELVYSLSADKGGVALREVFIDAKGFNVRGEDKAQTKVSYFRGRDRSKWIRGLLTYNYVDLGEVWSGVRIKVKAYGKRVEKLFYIEPGAKVEEIRVKVEGAKRLQVAGDERLRVVTEKGDVYFTRPLAYQEVSGKKRYVEVAYVVKGNEYRFKVGEYDHTKPLIIDPLLASTYLGGSSSDYVNAIAIDLEGNVYVAGYTWSYNFPVTDGAFDNNPNDIFISKLSSDLTTLLASTYLGGSSGDDANAIAIDSEGNVYVAGYTWSYNFPVTDGAFQTEYSGGWGDAFISKLSSDLTTLLASTYLGGIGYDHAYGIAIDSEGNVYVAGYTGSSDFPVTDGAYQTEYGGYDDAFISKLSSDLTILLASTYLGGSDWDDEAHAIAIDSEGNVYVAGETHSSDFPVTDGAYQSEYSGWGDAFISKLSSNLTTLLASTYLGGNDSDYANAIAIDSEGNVYVAGKTDSYNFPVTDSAYQTEFGGGDDAFISKLDSNLSSGQAVNQPPVITSFTAEPESGEIPLLVTFTCNAYDPDPDGTIISYNWDFDGDGTWDSTTATGTTSYIYYNPGTYTAKVQVLDNGGASATAGPLVITVTEGYATLTITKMGVGSGRVTSNPSSIDCGSVCSAQFTQGTTVTLTATPDADSVFAGWGGDCSSCGIDTNCEITMDADKTCTATFELREITGSAKGTVYGLDMSSIYAPLSDVEVRFREVDLGNEYTTSTAQDGTFEIELPIGVYEVQFTKDGYYDMKYYEQVTVTQGETVILNDITLVPESILPEVSGMDCVLLVSDYIPIFGDVVSMTDYLQTIMEIGAYLQSGEYLKAGITATSVLMEEVVPILGEVSDIQDTLETLDGCISDISPVVEDVATIIWDATDILTENTMHWILDLTPSSLLRADNLQAGLTITLRDPEGKEIVFNNGFEKLEILNGHIFKLSDNLYWIFVYNAEGNYTLEVKNNSSQSFTGKLTLLRATSLSRAISSGKQEWLDFEGINLSQNAATLKLISGSSIEKPVLNLDSNGDGNYETNIEPEIVAEKLMQNLSFTDFSSFQLSNSEITVGDDGKLNFDFSGSTPSEAYYPVSFTTASGQTYTFDFQLDSFSDSSTRRIVLFGFTKDRFFRTEGDSGWWGEFAQPEGIYGAIHSACFGCPDAEQSFVYKLYAKKNGTLYTLFSSQGYDDFSYDYGRYRFILTIDSSSQATVKFYEYSNNSWNLLKVTQVNVDLTGIDINYARIWDDRMQSYSLAGEYRGKVYELSIEGLTNASSISEEAPIIDSFTADPTSGDAPLEVTFTCIAHDPDGSIAQYKWDFDGDGSVDQTTTDAKVIHTYNNAGTYNAKVTVVDDDGTQTTSNPITITVTSSESGSNEGGESGSESGSSEGGESGGGCTINSNVGFSLDFLLWIGLPYAIFILRRKKAN